MLNDYKKQISERLPRNRNFSEWISNGVHLIDCTDPYLFAEARYITKNFDDLIIVLISNLAVDTYSAWDNPSFEVRWREPYFYKDDPVRWKIY